MNVVTHDLVKHGYGNDELDREKQMKRYLGLLRKNVHYWIQLEQGVENDWTCPETPRKVA